MLERLLRALDVLGFLKHGGKKKLADLTGYSTSSVSDMLTGKMPLGDKFVRLLVRQLGISDAWLRMGEGEMFTPGVEREQLKHERDDLLDSVLLDLERAYRELSPEEKVDMVIRIRELARRRDGDREKD